MLEAANESLVGLPAGSRGPYGPDKQPRASKAVEHGSGQQNPGRRIPRDRLSL